MQVALDSDDFVDLPWQEKLHCLLEAAGATDDAPAILGGELATATQGDVTQGDVVDELTDAADQLLSVLGYVMRLARYEPEGMRRVWRAKDTYRQSLEKPPWAQLSLQTFLVRRGTLGLQDALRWIRAH